jgi:hypothetical protein
MRAMREVRRFLFLTVLAGLWAFPHDATSGWIWVEGEKPFESNMNRHPWWYDQVKKDPFSGGDFISNFDKEKPGRADYWFEASDAAYYEFWVRANPFASKLSYSLNGARKSSRT